MTIDRLRIQRGPMLVFSAAVMFAACSSSSNGKDGAQSMGGSGGTSSPDGTGGTSSPDSSTGRVDSGSGGSPTDTGGSTVIPDGSGGSSSGVDTSVAGRFDSAASTGGAMTPVDGSAGGSGGSSVPVDGNSMPESGGGTHCCGCLCRDPAWSCSAETCVDPSGLALTTAAEAGFFELSGGEYVSEGETRVGPVHRVWYAFQPASTSPADKPLAVFFNGGPGSATSAFLFSENIAPFTLDPEATGGAQIATNPNSWTRFANLLFIDPPACGFSYPTSVDDENRPSLAFDLDHDAAAVVRVIVRFLDRHPALQKNPVILVGESYGGTRAELMLKHLLDYQSLVSEAASYRDSELYGDLVRHFTAMFPQEDPRTLSPAQVAQQFGYQVLIQPFVAGKVQLGLNTPDYSVCRPDNDFDTYQCDEPTSWTNSNSQVVADRLTRIATLQKMLGIDPTTIDWLYASARTHAYGRTTGILVDTPEMDTTFGPLGTDDHYFLLQNIDIMPVNSPRRSWATDSTLGADFLKDLVYVKTFITNAKYDTIVWTPAIVPALATYTSLVSDVSLDTTVRPGNARKGWIKVTYAQGAGADPATREIRFPFYEAAGHAVPIRASAELLADVMDWYSSGS